MPIGETGFIEPIKPGSQNSDTILGVASNGYIKRTGANTYTNISDLTSDLPSGTMFNLQQTQLTTTFTTNSTSYTDVTGLSVSITPKSSSNTVLVRAVVQVGTNSGATAMLQLVRGSTPIGIGTSPGSRTAGGGCTYNSTNSAMGTVVLEWLDSPATTSSTTYKVQILANASANVYVNRTDADTNSSSFPRVASTITVTEVHA